MSRTHYPACEVMCFRDVNEVIKCCINTIILLLYTRIKLTRIMLIRDINSFNYIYIRKMNQNSNEPQPYLWELLWWRSNIANQIVSWIIQFYLYKKRHELWRHKKVPWQVRIPVLTAIQDFWPADIDLVVTANLTLYCNKLQFHKGI